MDETVDVVGAPVDASQLHGRSVHWQTPLLLRHHELGLIERQKSSPHAGDTTGASVPESMFEVEDVAAAVAIVVVSVMAAVVVVAEEAGAAVDEEGSHEHGSSVQ